jgi:hypothetical protein
MKERKMKKFLSLVLVIVMMAALVGCGGGVELTRGVIEGDLYKNESLGLNFNKPSSWVYSTDEEIAASMNFAVDNLLDENFKNALENNPTIYDMMVVDTITRTNLNVGFENLKKTMSSNITVEQYVDALKKQLAEVSAMTVSFHDGLETVKLGETEFTKLVCDTKMSGVKMTQVYYLRKVDGYMTFVIVTITSGYTVADIEAMFS